MSDVIRLLPDSLANQIAAGEVVQRPASALKELLENAIDAGAQSITVLIKDAGKVLIQVIDDGVGMSDTDARLCFERHATSKIRQPDDLFAIKTFGFRGEALPSIAAVAQVELITRRIQDEVGVKIHIEASELKKQDYTAAPTGTSIAVKNLFFNVPARRKFLKGNNVEFKHLLEEFQRAALAYPHISFRFISNDQELYNLSGGLLAKRIVGILGKTYQQNLVSCEEEVQDYALTGFVGKPEVSKKTRGEQFFFVNNRFVKHPSLHHAVMSAYKGLLPDENFPFYALFISLPYDKIDVNVHPTKTEVKFEDERLLYALLLAAVRRALGVYAHVPSLEFKPDVLDTTNFKTSASKSQTGKNESFNSANSPQERLSKINTHNWEKLYKDLETERLADASEEFSFVFQQDSSEEADLSTNNWRVASRANESGNSQSNDTKSELIFQLHNAYIASRLPSSLLLIDQQAAHFRILYERFMRQHLSQSPISQRLLFDQELALPPSDVALLLENIDLFRNLGFDLLLEADGTLQVRSVPPECVQQSQLSEIIAQLIEQLRATYNDGSAPNYVHQAAITLAKRQSKKRGEKLLTAEMAKIIDELYACEQPNYTPDGQKIHLLLDVEMLDGLFGI